MTTGGKHLKLPQDCNQSSCIESFRQQQTMFLFLKESGLVTEASQSLVWNVTRSQKSFTERGRRELIPVPRLYMQGIIKEEKGGSVMMWEHFVFLA